MALVGISAVGVSYGANIQPEAIASAYRYSGDLDVFTLSSNDVTVSCPSDEKRTTLYSETKKIQISPIHYSWYEYGDPFAKPEFLGHRSHVIEGYTMYVIDAIIDSPGNYVIATLILEKEHTKICVNDTELSSFFVVDLTVKCDGSFLEGITTDPLGINFTSTNYEIACIP